MEAIGPLPEGDTAPLYLQVQRAIRVALRNGGVDLSAPLPPERDLARELKVSRITVRKAIAGLVDEGLLRRRQGAGTFLADDAARIQKSFYTITSFTEDMAARGLASHSEWISRTEGPVTPEESLMLGLSPRMAVYRFARLRFANEKAMAIEHSTIAAFCLPSIDAVESSLYAALEANGHRPVRALQRLRAIGLDADQSERLGVEVGAPALLIERRGFLADGRAIEVTTSWYRGDSYDFLAELTV